MNFNDVILRDLGLLVILYNLGITVIIAFYIFVVYKKTYNNVVYSLNFNITLVMITIITAMIMMSIQSNLALSLGMVGALSIIRFRTAIKDPKDVAFIFWAVTAGLSSGTGSHMIAIVGSIILTVVLVILSLADDKTNSYLLVLNSRNFNDKDFEKQMKNLKVKFDIKTFEIRDGMSEVVYEIKTNQSLGDITKELKANTELDYISIMSSKGEIIG